jgi:acyl-CoA thioesterase
LTITIHYLDRPEEGPVTVSVEILRVGRSHASMEGRLMQGDRTIAVGLCTTGKRRRDAARSIQAAMPEYPPPSECVALPLAEFQPGMTFRHRFDNLVRPDEPPFFERKQPGPAVMGGWTRLVDRDLDRLAVPLFLDSWPPAMFMTMLGGYAPTVELTVHWRSDPKPGWHLARFTSRFLIDGYVEEDGELWSEDGVLVAQSRQLALFIATAP